MPWTLIGMRPFKTLRDEAVSFPMRKISFQL